MLASFTSSAALRFAMLRFARFAHSFGSAPLFAFAYLLHRAPLATHKKCFSIAVLFIVDVEVDKNEYDGAAAVLVVCRR